MGPNLGPTLGPTHATKGPQDPRPSSGSRTKPITPYHYYCPLAHPPCGQHPCLRYTVLSSARLSSLRRDRAGARVMNTVEQTLYTVQSHSTVEQTLAISHLHGTLYTGSLHCALSTAAVPSPELDNRLISSFIALEVWNMNFPIGKCQHKFQSLFMFLKSIRAL